MANWTADKDQIILKGIFKFHDIKSSAPLLKYLSEEIGGDCTPKAVSHRLTNIRKGGTTHANNGAVNSSALAVTYTPKTPHSRAKATPRKKKVVSEDIEGDCPQGLMDDAVSLSPSAARGKRTLNGAKKHKYDESSDKEDGEGGEDVEDEYVPLGKRVKVEDVDVEKAFIDEFVEDEI